MRFIQSRKRFFFPLAVLALFWSCGSGNTNTTMSAYERVMKTRVLKAAYTCYPLSCVPGKELGSPTGISVDILNKICENLHLKLEWVAEVGWDTHIEGLIQNRYDIIGSTVWPIPERTTNATLSKAIYYNGIGLFVREDDHRFDKNLAKLNSSEIKIVTIDGDFSSIICREKYPKAKTLSFPDNFNRNECFLAVASTKCDAAIFENVVAMEYSKHFNVRNAAAEKPLRTYGNCFMVKPNEFKMKQMLDSAIDNLINIGYVESILHKYENGNKLFYMQESN